MPPPPPERSKLPIRRNSSPPAIHRRRRDVRAVRDRVGEQFEQLRRVLPKPRDGVELSAKAQILEQSVEEIQRLMRRATALAVELAVVSPAATRTWVKNITDDGRKPLLRAVADVMKLFAAQSGWRYAEWWTLDEGRGGEGGEFVGGGEVRGNLHACNVRDSISVMRLGWSIINRAEGERKMNGMKRGDETEDETELTETDRAEANMSEEIALEQFARASSRFEFSPRVGMPGRVWSSRQAEWLVDLKDETAFRRSPLAVKFGMKTCLAVPIVLGGHVHSVMAFFSRQTKAYNPKSYDLACLLSQSLEDVYAPNWTAT